MAASSSMINTEPAEEADGSLGRRVTEFYRARGFAYPGRPGSAPPLLCQHDWVHVLADYGTTVESELEVFALNDKARRLYERHGFKEVGVVPGKIRRGRRRLDIVVMYANLRTAN